MSADKLRQRQKAIFVPVYSCGKTGPGTMRGKKIGFGDGDRWHEGVGTMKWGTVSGVR